MKHRVSHKPFGRNTNQLKALRRGLVSSLFENGKIETTLAKAKGIVPEVDRVMTFGKRGDMNARREVVKILGSDLMLNQIFTVVAPMTGNRTSGFTRIIKLGPRFSDATDMAVIELIDFQKVEIIKPQTDVNPGSSKEDVKTEAKTVEKPKAEKAKPTRVAKLKAQNPQKIKAIGNK